jgi:hypothetical protein
MISRQEHNELIRKAGRERLKNIQDRYRNSGARIYGHYERIRENKSEEEKHFIREGLKSKSRKSRRWTLILFSFSVLLFGFICYIILLSLSSLLSNNL